jgi:hypothetical protein
MDSLFDQLQCAIWRIRCAIWRSYFTVYCATIISSFGHIEDSSRAKASGPWFDVTANKLLAALIRQLTHAD